MRPLRWLLLPALLTASLAQAAPASEQQLREVLQLSAMDRTAALAAEGIVANPDMFPELAPAQRECLTKPLGAVLDELLVEGMLERLAAREDDLMPRWLAFYRSPAGKRMAALQRQQMYGEPMPKGMEGEPSDEERQQITDFVGSGAMEALMRVVGGMGSEMPPSLPQRVKERVKAECGFILDTEQLS